MTYEDAGSAIFHFLDVRAADCVTVEAFSCRYFLCRLPYHLTVEAMKKWVLL